MATTVPKQHIATRDTIDVASEVLVGTENNLCIFRERLHNLARIATGNDNIGERFCCRRSVYIAYHGVVGVSFHKLLECIGWATLCQRTRSVKVWHQNSFIGTKYLVGFAHEMHATHYDNICIGSGCFLRKGKAVAYEISQVLHFCVCVIMCHYHGILLFTHTFYFSLYIYIGRYRFVNKALFAPFLINHVL